MDMFFKLVGYQVVAGKIGDNEPYCEATLRIDIGGDMIHTADGGTGPVDALDLALRKALKTAYPEVDKFHLTDYQVSDLNPDLGTASPVKVVITTADDSGDEMGWVTIATHASIVEASWLALVEGITTGLRKHTALQVTA